jgi:hypothetical protein
MSDLEHRMSRGRRPTLLVYRVICSDEEAMHWKEEDLGNLRVALNALVRVFRMRPGCPHSNLPSPTLPRGRGEEST